MTAIAPLEKNWATKNLVQECCDIRACYLECVLLINHSKDLTKAASPQEYFDRICLKKVFERDENTRQISSEAGKKAQSINTLVVLHLEDSSGKALSPGGRQKNGEDCTKGN